MLTQSVDETKKKLDTLREAEKQVQEQFERGEISKEQYDGLKREIIATEEKLKSLEKEAARSNATLAKIGAVADDISKKTGEFASATKGISTAAGGAIVGIAGLGYAAANSADDLNTLAKQTGISTETLQQAKYAADLVDVSYETFTGSITKMVGKLRTNEQGFNDLGIATRNVNGEMLSTEDIFFNAAKALSQIDNETERDIAAQELFGKSAAELSGILDDGGKAFKEYGNQASELGLVLDQDTLNSLNEVNDEIDQLKADAIGTFAKSGAKALEALSPVLDDVADAISGVLEWVANLDAGQIKLALSVLAVVAAISPVSGIISKISGTISSLTPIISSVFSLLAANPIILIIAGIAAAVTALVVLIVKHWDEIKAWFAEMIAKVQETVDNIKQKIADFKQKLVQKFDDIRTGISNKVEALRSNITNKFAAIRDKIISPIQNARDRIKGFISDIKGFFSGLHFELPRIKTPHFKITGGKIPWGIGGLGTKPTVDVEWYHKAMNNAMLLDRPTIFGYGGGKFLGGGETGQEVVAGSSTLMNMIRGAVSEGGSDALLAEMQALNRNITNLGIYLDGDTLVGKLAPGIDNALGQSRDSYGRRALA